MPKNSIRIGGREVTSKRLVAIAARGIKAPSRLTMREVRSLAASVLTQYEPDRAEKLLAKLA